VTINVIRQTLKSAMAGLVLAALAGAAQAADGGPAVAPIPPVTPTAPVAPVPPAPLTMTMPDAPAAEAPAKAEEAAPASWPPGLLMDGLAPVGLDKLGLRVWGFLETGFTGRLTGGEHPLPLRGFDARRPNNFRLNQLRLTFDRPYDSAKGVDWGFRVDGLFGGDALLTHSPGFLDKAGHGTGDAWADLTQMYVQGWVKTGAESGLELTAGKFGTTLGAEVIDATGNALYSRGLLFNYAIPFTHTGVKANYVFNSQVSAYVAVVRGWEVFRDNNDAMSLMAGGALSSKEQIDGHARATLALNVITGPEQADNVSHYRTVADVLGTYWWTSKLSQTVNFDYGVEQGATASGGAAHWYGVANYFTYSINDYLAATWRAEWLRDDGGTRTGIDGNLYENTWGVSYTPWPKHPVLKNLVFRPELRWDFSDAPAFGGDRRNQVTAGFDVIFKF
jgi:hypothetical protein